MKKTKPYLSSAIICVVIGAAFFAVGMYKDKTNLVSGIIGNVTGFFGSLSEFDAEQFISEISDTFMNKTAEESSMTESSRPESIPALKLLGNSLREAVEVLGTDYIESSNSIDLRGLICTVYSYSNGEGALSLYVMYDTVVAVELSRNNPITDIVYEAYTTNMTVNDIQRISGSIERRMDGKYLAIAYPAIEGEEFVIQYAFSSGDVSVPCDYVIVMNKTFWE